MFLVTSLAARIPPPPNDVAGIGPAPAQPSPQG